MIPSALFNLDNHKIQVHLLAHPTEWNFQKPTSLGYQNKSYKIPTQRATNPQQSRYSTISLLSLICRTERQALSRPIIAGQQLGRLMTLLNQHTKRGWKGFPTYRNRVVCTHAHTPNDLLLATQKLVSYEAHRTPQDTRATPWLQSYIVPGDFDKASTGSNK